MNSKNYLEDRLWIHQQNIDIQKSVENSIKSRFPIVGKKKTIKLEELTTDYKLDPVDHKTQRDLKLSGKSWEVPVNASLSLVDNETGQVVDSARVKIGNIPMLTERVSVILDGNEYQTISQFRRKSGIYTRVKTNGELESEFNLARGYNFKLNVDPIKGIFYLVLANKHYELYGILKGLGVSDEKMRAAWGKKIFDVNQQAGMNNVEKSIMGVYETVSKTKPKSYEEALTGFASYLDNTEIDPHTTQITLGESFEKLTKDAMLASSKKLLRVQKGEDSPDERDSLAFKDLYSVDDLLGQYFEKNSDKIVRQLKSRADVKDSIKEIVSSKTFGKPIKDFFTTGDLSSTSPQTNPIEMLNEWRKTTVMGTGGIASRHAITSDTRDLHPSHIGFLDAVSTPDCLVGESEIFTKYGWKRLDEVNEEDLIACNINSRLEFHTPLRVVEHFYKGKMFYYEGKRLKYNATPNHRMWVKPENKHYCSFLPDFRFESVDELSKGPGKIRRFTGKHLPYVGDLEFTSFKLSDDLNIPIEPWCEFMGWFLSEGCTSRRKDLKEGRGVVNISQSSEANPVNYSEIEILLTEKLHEKITWGKTWTSFTSVNDELYTYLKQFGKAHEKFIPNILFDAPISARIKLYQSLMKGDGRYGKCKKGYHQEVFTTCSPQLAKDVERLSISIGNYVTVNEYTDNRKSHYKNIFEIRSLQKPFLTHSSKKVKTYDFEGNVYCVEVPGGMFLTRLQGSASYWTGNSFKVGITLPLSAQVIKQPGTNDLATPVIKANASGTRTALTDQIEYKTPWEMWNLRVGFPDQFEFKPTGQSTGKTKDLQETKISAKSSSVKGYYQGKHSVFSPGEVDYYIVTPTALFSWSSNLIPFLHSTQGNRASMGSRMMTQAVSLVNREAPYVQVSDGTPNRKSFEAHAGEFLQTKSAVAGVVTKIDDDYVHVKDDATGKTEKFGLYNNFPLNQESFLHSDPVVKVGDKVKKHQRLADHNFSKGGVLSLGVNSNVAYMPWKGFNFEDGIVVTDSFANKLTSQIMIRKRVTTNNDGIKNRTKYVSMFPHKVSPNNIKKLDEEGVVRVGEMVSPGDVIIAYMEPRDLTQTEMLLRKMGKATHTPYVDRGIEWDNQHTGEVVYVNKQGREITVHIKVKQPLIVGDKLCVDQDTQILTENGWKTIFEIGLEDKFCTLNPATQEIEYQEADQINLYEVDDEGLYFVKNKEVDLLVTTTHQMWFRYRTEKFYRLDIAGKMVGKACHYLKTGNWKDGDAVEGEALRAFKEKGTTVMRYAKSLKNSDNHGEIDSIIKNASAGEIRRFLGYFWRKNIGRGSSNETRFVETINEKFRDDVMELALKAGYASNYETIGTNDGWRVNINLVMKEAKVNYMHSYKSWDGTIDGFIGYTGFVGCPTTENGIIFVRRNGKTCWTGNSGRYGNKGIVTKIIPDHEAPHTKGGERIDIMLSPAGVPGRINPSQLMETAAGKWARKTGKLYKVDNFTERDNVDDIMAKLREAGIEPEEELLDGKDGKPFEEKVFWGNQYVLRLMHDIEHKLKARDRGGYDMDKVPSGGKTGGQKMDPMLMYSMLAAGAKENLRDATLIKGMQNDEVWRAIQLGLPIPVPKENFVWDKMIAHLQNAGVNVTKKGNEFVSGPLTDRELGELSSGPLERAGLMLVGKNLTPIEGGLFDPDKVGGMQGDKWSHIELGTKVPHPIFEDAIIRVLGITKPEFNKIIERRVEEGGLTGFKLLEKKLKDIDIKAELKATKIELAGAPESKRNALNKKYRYLSSLDRLGLKPEDYMISKFPVMPSKFRPVYPLPSGDLRVSPINNHYRNIALISDAYRTNKEMGLTEEFDKENDVSMYRTLKEAVGLVDPVHKQMANKPGVVKTLSGTSPKFGFIQGSVWSKRQDVSARSTVTVEPELGLDEAGIPYDMAKVMYKPFVVREFVQMGYSPIKALQEIKDETPLSKEVLRRTMAQRPVMLNRAPSLHRHSIQAFKPVLVPGKDIKTNPLINAGFNLDYNGDSIAPDTIIYAVLGNKVYSGTVDKFVKDYVLIGTSDDDLLEMANGGTLILDINDLYVLGTNESNHIKYMKAEQLTVHTSHGPCYSIKLPHNIPLVTTEHHNISVINPITLEEHSIKTEDLKAGAIVPLVKKINIDAEDIVSEMEIKDPTGKAFDKRVKINKTVKLDFNFGYWIGYFVGDGSITGNQHDAISMAGKTLEIQENVRNAYKATFDHDSGKQQDFRNYKTGGHLRFDCSPLARWMETECGQGALNKKFPEWFLNTSEDFRRGLIAGLMDSDGSVTYNSKNKSVLIVVQMISKQALLQLKLLLKTFGIQSSMMELNRKTKTNNNTVYMLRVNNTQITEVPFHENSPKKKKLFDLLEMYPGKVTRSSMDMIPYNPELHELIKEMGLTNRGLSKDNKALKIKLANVIGEYFNVSMDDSRGVSLGDLVGKTLISREIAIRILMQNSLHLETAKAEHELFSKWVDIIYSDLKYERVEAVDQVDRLPITYDFSLPQKETFVVDGGIITHNTMGVHLPVTREAVDEAWGLLPSKNVFKAGDNSVVHELSKQYQLGLYFLSKPSEAGFTGKKFANVDEAKKAGLGFRDVFEMPGGRKTTIGKEMINAVLPVALRDWENDFNGKYVDKLLERVAKEYPGDFGKVISSLKDLGNQYGHTRGSTLSISDLSVDKKIKQGILDKWEKQLPKTGKPDTNTLIKVYSGAKQEIEDELRKRYGGTNRFYEWRESGALGAKGEPSQIIGMPGLFKDVKNNVIPIPIKNNYSEGLDTFDYWNTLYAARKGTVDRAVNTQDSGALNKRLIGVTRDMIIKSEDCKTDDGIELEINDRNIMDRTLAVDVRGVGKAGDLVDPLLVSKARDKKVESMLVRSPLTCELPDGLCAKCYGLMPNGKFPEIGTNVGILEGQALTERSTQLTMRCQSKDGMINYSYKGEKSICTHEELWDKIKSDVTYTGNGNIETKEVKGLKVLSDKGSWVEVEKAQRHKPTVPMVIIRTNDGNALVTQEDHPLRVYPAYNECKCHTPSLRQINNDDFKCNTCKRKHNPEIVYDKFRDITLDKVNLKSEGFLVDYSFYLNKNDEKNDPIFNGYLTGIYTGDGCLQKSNDSGKYWGILISSFNDDISDYIKDSVKLANLTPNSTNENSIKIYNVEAAKKMENLVTSYAKNKKLIGEYYKYSKRWLADFLSGLIDSDGCVVKKNNNTYIKIYSSSWALMQQVFIMSKILDFKCKLNISKISDATSTVGAKSTTQPYYAEIRLKPENTELFDSSFKVKKDYNKESKIFKDFYITKGVDPIVSSAPLEIYDDYTYDFKVEGSMYSVNGIGYHNTFHSGGAVGTGGGGVVEGFPRLEQLLKVPATLPNKATLARVTGRVEKISPHLTGGKEIWVDRTLHVVPTGYEVLVKVGDAVNAGDPLSSGSIKPQELAELKDFRTAQRYMVDELDNIMDKKFFKKTFETVIRGTTNNAEILDSGDYNGETEIVPGDRVKTSWIKSKNKQLLGAGKKPIMYKEYFKSIDMLPDDNPDWVDRVSNIHIKSAIKDMAATNMASNIHGNSPMPGYLYALEFGRNKEDSNTPY